VLPSGPNPSILVPVRENRSQYAILGALALKPMSGYDLKRFVDESVRHFWTESFGQIYPILRRLESDGLVERQAGESTGARERIVYSITPAGRVALARWVAEPARFEVGRVEILLKLFFARNGPPGTAESLLRVYRAELQERLSRYSAIEERLQSERSTFADLPYWLATLSYGKHVSHALVDWCDESMATLSDGSKPGA
jgi:PadR family transcriptional regulator AphA